MRARYDFVSEKTGRILLSSLLDAPQDRLPAGSTKKLLHELVSTRKRLEKILGEGLVRLSLDAYEPSVFWALVLFRPLYLKSGHVSVYDILLENPADLQKMDLGVVYEPKHALLLLDWKEAWNGVLENLELAPSWGRILEAAEKRSGEKPGASFWKDCAESHSWVMPEWVQRKLGLLRKRVWFRPELSYGEVTVLDVRGIPVIRLEGESLLAINEAKLLAPRSVKFIHHYTTGDKRELFSARNLQRKAMLAPEKLARIRAQQLRANRLRRKQEKAARMDDEKKAWRRASRIVGELPRAIGKGFSGKYPLLMTSEESDNRLRHANEAYLNGELRRSQWKKVVALLNELEELLKDPVVPGSFRDWLVWRDRKEVEHVIAQDQGFEPASDVLPAMPR